MSRAKRLVRRAERRRADGSLGRRARRAWRALWVMTEQPEGLRAVFDAFMDPQQIYGARHDSPVVFPSDGSMERAFLFLYTGQLAEYEALDPDGSLIVTAYWLTTKSVQDTVRQTLVDAGKLHVVRLLTTAGSREGVQDMSAEEIADLARLLAEHREWARLWRLVRDAPLGSALAAMPLFARWRPRDAAGAELFDQLAALDPDAVESLERRAVGYVGSSTSREASFAPDLSEIAVADASSITVHGLPDGTRLTTYGEWRLSTRLLHLGDQRVVSVKPGQATQQLVRHVPGRSAEVLLTDRRIGLARTPPGFVAGTSTGLVLGTATGDLGPALELDVFDLGSWDGRLASDPEAERIAVVSMSGGQYLLTLLDADLWRLADTTLHDVPDGLLVHGPDLVFTWGEERESLRSWRRDGDRLVLAVDGPPESTVDPPRRAQGVPIGWHPDVVEWFDPETLEQVSGPAGYRSSDAPMPTLSWYGDLAAVVRPEHPKRGVEVRDLHLSEVVELIWEPIVTAVPAMLDTATALETPDLDEDTVALLRVFRACLEYRFGTEVALGDPVRPRAHDDDIALGGDRAARRPAR